jgi:hypothetical protein
VLRTRLEIRSRNDGVILCIGGFDIEMGSIPFFGVLPCARISSGHSFGVTQGKEKHCGHDGGSPGASASFEVFPESGYAVIVLSNQGRRSRDVAQALIGLVLAREQTA